MYIKRMSLWRQCRARILLPSHPIFALIQAIEGDWLNKFSYKEVIEDTFDFIDT